MTCVCLSIMYVSPSQILLNMIIQFFAHFDNNSHAGDCAMVLQPLTRIYYHRGDYEACGQVLEMHAKVLHYCKLASTVAGEDRITNFCAWSEYNTNKTSCELNLRLKHHSKNVSLFKELCHFEMTQAKHDQNLSKRWKTLHRKCKNLGNLSDAMILEVIKVHSSEMIGTLEADSAQRVQLHECGLCKKKETSLGEFMNCWRCKSVAYCGRECQKQKKHWKVHKKSCTTGGGQENRYFSLSFYGEHDMKKAAITSTRKKPAANVECPKLELVRTNHASVE